MQLLVNPIQRLDQRHLDEVPLAHAQDAQGVVQAIHQIAEASAGAPVQTQALSDRLGVSTASVTGMMKKLDQYRLVEHEPYRGVVLTPKGEQVALEVLRHHRLLELYLVEQLGMSWEDVHAEADRLEHVISEVLEDRIAAALERLPPYPTLLVFVVPLAVLFPLDYWPLITKYSLQHGLDPYLVAALMAQESTFTAEIRSSANAYGLMQLIPSTGRRYASKVGLRGFSTAALTRPETNVRLGMTYFKDLMDRFGGAHFALASYNAGYGAVTRYGGVPPYAETQNYVQVVMAEFVVEFGKDGRRVEPDGRLDAAGARDDVFCARGARLFRRYQTTVDLFLPP